MQAGEGAVMCIVAAVSWDPVDAVTASSSHCHGGEEEAGPGRAGCSQCGMSSGCSRRWSSGTPLSLPPTRTPR